MPNNIFATGAFDSRGMSVASPTSNSPGTGGANVPAYEQVTSIPSWLPARSDAETELLEQYRNTNSMFDTDPYRRSVDSQRARVLTSSMNAGNAAAAGYASRARQAGGSGSLGADLIRAQLQVGAHAEAGKMDIEKEKFIAERRGEAAKHAAGIASTLGGLRSDYLKTIADYAARQNATNASYAVGQRNAAANERNAATAAAAEARANRGSSGGLLGYSIGHGLGTGSNQFTFGSELEAQQYADDHRYGGSIYAGLGTPGAGGYGG